MILESACIPLPSEVIMPFSGYVAWKGGMSILGVTIIGAL
ncbi:MAG TPA: DedA family protein, partial [Methanobacteriales archaeon]|nr:DedA family protein [Methanobacteriales archaeon]